MSKKRKLTIDKEEKDKEPLISSLFCEKKNPIEPLNFVAKKKTDKVVFVGKKEHIIPMLIYLSKKYENTAGIVDCPNWSSYFDIDEWLNYETKFLKFIQTRNTIKEKNSAKRIRIHNELSYSSSFIDKFNSLKSNPSIDYIFGATFCTT